MKTITCLSDEMIEIILSYSDITVEDIINFRCVCKQFRPAAKYDHFMKRKFLQRWPFAKELFDNQSEEKEYNVSKEISDKQKDENNLKLIETGINYARELRSYVYILCLNHEQHDRLIDNVTKFRDVFHLDKVNVLIKNIHDIMNKRENYIKYSFFIDEVKNLLTESPRRAGYDLTVRYCIMKMFQYMGMCKVEKMYSGIQNATDESPLELIATIVAQSIQPQRNVFYSSVKTLLNNIAQGALKYLREKHPDHSICSMSTEILSQWRNNNIVNDHWNEVEGMQIMDTLKEYIFGELNYRACESEDRNLENMCIYNVLINGYGHEIILLIIYHSVARSLGLYCNIINLRYAVPPKYCIFWTSERNGNSLANVDVRCFSISCEKYPNCLVNQTPLFRRLYSMTRFLDVFLVNPTLMWYEMRELVECLINQYDNTFRINPREFTYDSINYMITLNFNLRKKLNTRPKNVKFGVGMIVNHSDHDQHTDPSTCAGVIIGWHLHEDRHLMCKKEPRVLCPIKHFTLQSELMINHCNINLNKKQTYYIILTENNKMCYVEEDAITLTTPKWINNSEIGRYFCEFKNTHYVPNTNLTKFYPHDAALTAQTIVSEN